MLESCERILQCNMLQVSARSLTNPVPSVAAIVDKYTRDVAGECERLRDIPCCGTRGLCLHLRKGTCDPGDKDDQAVILSTPPIP